MILVTPSPWLMEKVKLSFLNKYDVEIINNGLNTEIFKSYDNNILKKEINVKNKKMILHVTPEFSDDINHVKGGYYLIKLAEKLKKQDIIIVVIGNNKCQSKVPDNIIFLGKIEDSELLAKYYSLADLFVLTSKRETFSMTTAESLACGTPVVGFKSGAPEQIAISEYSDFVEFGDVEELYNKIIIWLNKGKDKNIEKVAKHKYSRQHMAEEYLKLFNE